MSLRLRVAKQQTKHTHAQAHTDPDTHTHACSKSMYYCDTVWSGVFCRLWRSCSQWSAALSLRSETGEGTDNGHHGNPPTHNHCLLLSVYMLVATVQLIFVPNRIIVNNSTVIIIIKTFGD